MEAWAGMEQLDGRHRHSLLAARSRISRSRRLMGHLARSKLHCTAPQSLYSVVTGLLLTETCAIVRLSYSQVAASLWPWFPLLSEGGHSTWTWRPKLLDMVFTLPPTKHPANDGTPRNARRFTAVPGVPTWKPPSGPVFRS